MQDEDKLYTEVVALFRENPWLEDSVVVIGGVARMLRLKDVPPTNIQPTTDLDLALKLGVDIAELKEALGDLKHDLLQIDPITGAAGPLSSEATAIVMKDIDKLLIEGIRIPVVGPVGLLVSKLNRSGEKGREYARGKDLLDVINVWLGDSDCVRERINKLKEMPGVKDALNEFRLLMQDEYSKGTRAVLHEMDTDIGDMEFIILRMNLDKLLNELPGNKP